jgi:RimJ/RimL family protein N-acetyltransferase
VSRFGQLGVTQIRLDTAAANEPARRLFASVGFRPSVIEMLREIR